MVNENGLIISNFGYPSRSRGKVTLVLERAAEEEIEDICTRNIGRFSRVRRLHNLSRHDARCAMV